MGKTVKKVKKDKKVGIAFDSFYSFSFICIYKTCVTHIISLLKVKPLIILPELKPLESCKLIFLILGGFFVFLD